MAIQNPRKEFGMLALSGTWDNQVFIWGGVTSTTTYPSLTSSGLFYQTEEADSTFGRYSLSNQFSSRSVNNVSFFSNTTWGRNGVAIEMSRVSTGSIFIFGGAKQSSLFPFNSSSKVVRVFGADLDQTEDFATLTVPRAYSKAVWGAYTDSGSNTRDSFFVYGGNSITIDRLVFGGSYQGVISINPGFSTVSGSAHASRLGDYVLFVGGISSATLSPAVFKISGTNSTITQLTGAGTLTTMRAGFASCLDYLGRLWVVGGISGSTYLSSTEIFSFTAQTWSVGPALPSASAHGKLVAASGSDYLVYVAGISGTTLQSGWKIRTESTGSGWTALPTMYTPRANPGVARLSSGKIFVFGGEMISGSSKYLNPLAAEELTYSGSSPVTWSHSYAATAFADNSLVGVPQFDSVIITNGAPSINAWPPVTATISKLSQSAGTGSFNLLSNLTGSPSPTIGFVANTGSIEWRVATRSLMNNSQFYYRTAGMTATFTGTIDYLPAYVLSQSPSNFVTGVPGDTYLTWSGGRLDHPVTVSFYNNAVYGGVEFTGTVIGSGALSMTLRTPLSTSVANGVNLRAGVTHNAKLYYLSGSGATSSSILLTTLNWSSSLGTPLRRKIDTYVAATWSFEQGSTQMTGGLYISGSFSTNMAQGMSGRTSIAGIVGNGSQNNAGNTGRSSGSAVSYNFASQLFHPYITAEFWYKGVGASQTFFGISKTGTITYQSLGAPNDWNDDGAQNELLLIGVDSSRRPYIEWDTGYRYTTWEFVDIETGWDMLSFDPNRWAIQFDYTLPNDSNWRHVAVVRSNTQGYLYLNGQLVSTANIYEKVNNGFFTVTSGTAYPGYWGNSIGMSGTMYLGNFVATTSSIDEISLSRTARAQADISESYARGLGYYYV